MPLRSPKMYFCIFGFQRLVWWPKCTPASSSSFMVNVAIALSCSVGLRPRVAVPDPSGPRFPGSTGDRNARSCVVVLRLGRVLRIQPDVLLGQVGGPHPVLSPPLPEVDRDRVLAAPHHLADPLELRAGDERAVLHQLLIPDRDA